MNHDPTVDTHPWRVALMTTLAMVAVAMAWTCWLGPALHAPGRWWIPGDVWVPMPAAHYIGNGAFPALYEPEPAFVYFPGLPIVLTPLALVGDWLRLSETSSVVVVPRPTMWLVLGPYGLLLSALPLVVIRRMATEFGASRWARPAVQVASGAALSLAAIVWGHYEEALTIGLLLLASQLSLKDRHLPAAWVLAGAILSKQTALLAAPILLLRVPPGPMRRRAIAVAAGVPAAAVALCLAIDWRHASAALLAAPSYPRTGWAALWVAAQAKTVRAGPLRLVALAAAAGLGWAVRRRREPTVVLSAITLALTARLLTEPVVFPYYLSGPVVFAIMAAMAGAGRGIRPLAGGGIGAGLFLISSSSVLWWLSLLAALVLLAADATRYLLRSPSDPRLPI